ncbi:Amidohydrolase [Komagataeibacter saccharivorans]|uniref:2-amino-3-carboxymuconate-6-semialdehyde decarboxylase n=1 Tax=Komagataeibacter saccharivorans TaxID=265959 RepID=A0A347WBN2_9PROT|nr:amidohydrolase family protein [Komagataeibacter saccharivorans]AXY22275.1 Amidohydrolase [Komagataeibacter saccharivorans]
MIIDLHSHFLPAAWPDLQARFGTPDWPWMRHVDDEHAMLMLGTRDFRPVYDACWNAQRRVAEMDRDGIDIQVISATPILFAYGRPAAQAEYCARIFNDAALEICSHAPTRLRALAQVPLQDTDMACREASRAMASGHVGVQIGNHVGDRGLDDAGIMTFLHHCAQEDIPLLIHPWDMMTNARMGSYMLPWLVSMPAETQLSILSLILSGAFERLPRNLRLCFAHGGGSFPYLLGRVDNAWRNRDIVRVDCPNLPSSYVDRFHVDSAVFDPDALELLVRVMGDERIMLGSDYPFPLGESPVGGLVRSATFLGADARARILGGNAAAFLGLSRNV